MIKHKKATKKSTSPRCDEFFLKKSLTSSLSCAILDNNQIANQTDEAEIKAANAQSRESGVAENRAEMQAVKWTAEGALKSGDVTHA